MNTEWSQEQINDFTKCKNDPIYFIEKYFYVISPYAGKYLLKLKDEQKLIIKHWQINKKFNVDASRQLGVSTIFAAYSLWTAIFTPYAPTVALAAHRLASSRSILEMIRYATIWLPQYWNIRVSAANRDLIRFEHNYASIISIGDNFLKLRGHNIALLILDDAEFISNLYENMYDIFPVVSNANSKILSEGMRDYDNFKFNSIRIPYKVKNDKEFKEKMIKSIGIDSWNKEYELL